MTPVPKRSDAEPAPSHDWFARVVIGIVVATWAAGAGAQILMPDRYSEPWWIHVIALCTVSYALTGQFAQSRLLPMLRDNFGAPKT